MKKGKVYLVGAGPGDPDLISVKALKNLNKADIVVYDRLISKAILRLIPEKTSKIYVGKQTGIHTVPQEEIGKILVNEASKGNNVVRLKGGDPFLFGRGGEEAQALHKAKISFEVVPGITSAIAVPTYAGIPLTHREYSSSVAIVTGHENPKKPKSQVRWEKLATAVDTIVVVMGVKRIDSIVKNLIDAGKDPKTNVAIIDEGTTNRQKMIFGHLNNIAQKTVKKRVKPPAIIIIGNVVKLRKELSWIKK